MDQEEERQPLRKENRLDRYSRRPSRPGSFGRSRRHGAAPLTNTKWTLRKRKINNGERGIRLARGSRAEAIDLSFRKLVRRIRMPSPLPLVDTHPLGSCFSFFFPERTPPSAAVGCFPSIRDHVAATWADGSIAQVRTQERSPRKRVYPPGGERTLRM
ncbi:hypothetical protein KM043_015322 [Ampulex compressa]|nr:hypothetical protein KM043_015322 [Ampulex compressa]